MNFKMIGAKELDNYYEYLCEFSDYGEQIKYPTTTYINGIEYITALINNLIVTCFNNNGIIESFSSTIDNEALFTYNEYCYLVYENEIIETNIITGNRNDIKYIKKDNNRGLLKYTSWIQNNNESFSTETIILNRENLCQAYLFARYHNPDILRYKNKKNKEIVYNNYYEDEYLLQIFKFLKFSVNKKEMLYYNDLLDYYKNYGFSVIPSNDIVELLNKESKKYNFVKKIGNEYIKILDNN